MDIDQLIKIASPFIAIVFGAFVKNYTEKKSNLIAYYGHASSSTIKQAGDFVLNTHNVVIRNGGKKTAFNVRVGHNYLPEDTDVYPSSANFSITENPNGASEIIFPTIVENEQIIISYSYLPPLTVDKINSYIKSDDGYCSPVVAIPSPPKAISLIFCEYALMFLGLSFLVYIIANIAKNII